MTMPVYVSPEQLMKDRADYARKGIARGRSVVVVSYDRGIVLVAETASRTLHKISEIYDRIAFAAVGKYNEFENLRVAGVRYADLRGYSYDRSDVSARGLANAYAQTLGTVFTQESKPYEVELAVAQVGGSPQEDEIYRLTYDGSVTDEPGYLAMGGSSERITEGLRERWRPQASLAEALGLAVELLAGEAPEGERPQPLGTDRLEVAVLDRQRPRRTFRRLGGPLLSALLDPASPATHLPSTDDARPGHHDLLTEAETNGTAVAPVSAEDPADHGHASTNPQTQQDDGADGADGTDEAD